MNNNTALKTSRNFLQQSIILKQNRVNHGASINNKTCRNDLISAKKNVRFKGRNSIEQTKIINNNLATIQKEQIQLKNIENANDLINSRIQDEENLLKHYQQFPYDKENVDIKEDVLERYRKNGDYLSQSRMLQKFRLEAEMLKKHSKKKTDHRLKRFESQLRNYDSSDKNKSDLEEMKRRLQKQLEEERRLRELQELKMKNISSSLNSLAGQLENNAFTLEKGIRDLHRRLDNRPKEIRLPKRTLPYPDTLDLQMTSRKIPIVMYEDQPFDARLYFSDMYKPVPKQNYSYTENSDRNQYKEILKILRENDRRIKYLNKLTTTENDYEAM